MRTWLLTWTTYGTWLPGDARGSVASVRQGPGPRRERDTPGEPFEAPMPALEAASRKLQREPAAFLAVEHAQPLLEQLLKTAAYRDWVLLAAAIVSNHIHIVVTAAEEVSPEVILRDMKAYGSRVLNQIGPRRRRWWTRRGSRRYLPHDRAVQNAIEYVQRQPGALLVWSRDPPTF
ncbi:MAG: transposase [Thermogutta sp.]